MKARNEKWLNELILCGFPYPITRREAIANMMADGMESTEAVRACRYFDVVKSYTQVVSVPSFYRAIAPRRPTLRVIQGGKQ